MLQKDAAAVLMVDSVIRFIDDHREQAINRLFPGAVDAFKLEWNKKEVYNFWTSLNSDLQLEIVSMAVNYYK